MDRTKIDHVRRKYKDRMLQLAFVVSGWSQEAEGQRHGCVLAVDGKYIVATGFNGPCRNGHNVIVHAEENAILNLEQFAIDGPVWKNVVAYVTKRPCENCMRILKDWGIHVVFWLQDVGGDKCLKVLNRRDSNGRLLKKEKTKHHAGDQGQGHGTGKAATNGATCKWLASQRAG